MTPILANVAVDYFVRGGPIMWPILFALFAAVFVVLERAFWWWSLRRRAENGKLDQALDAITNGNFERAVQISADAKDPFLGTIHEGLIHAHSSMLGAMQLLAPTVLITDEESARRVLALAGGSHFV